MPLPTKALSAIQAAGAAVYAADQKVKKSVQEYADQVKQAMLQNPFDIGNDTLFEDWKTVARLSQAIGQIESELKRIYSAAVNLSGSSRPSISTMPTLEGPQNLVSNELEVVKEIKATDAVVKKALKKKKTNSILRKKQQRALSGNAKKVLAGLFKVLNANDFLKINQSSIAADVGLPKGSIGASITKLVETGHLSVDPTGAFKLSSPSAHPQI